MSRRKKPDYVRTGIFDEFNVGYQKNNPQLSYRELVRRMYERVLTEMCMNRFTWTGTPNSIDKRFIELSLFYNGLVVFFYDYEFNRFLALKGSGNGAVNMYNNPTKFRVYGNQAINKELGPKECVPIWANYTRHTDVDIVRIYAELLADATVTTKTNMLGARHPFVISVDANERLSMLNAFRKVEEGQPVIFGTDAFSPAAMQEKMNVFNMSLPKDSLSEMQELKTKLFNEALSMLGIMNVNSEKKERMVAEEASGSSGQVLAMRSIALNSRREACNQINRMFGDLLGEPIGVEWNLSESGEDEDMDESDPTDMESMGNEAVGDSNG